MGTNTFSIKDLEHLSGIKAHTLRIWEQRYELIHPKRTPTNIRYYDNADLKLILNVALLKENGFKISRIARMSESERQEQILNLLGENLNYPEQVQALTITMIDMDEERFEKLIASCILKLGFERTILNIIFPFLSRIGILWQTGAINPAREHFISNLVRQKLITAIDGLYFSPDKNSPKYVLFLPEGELHELSLLFADYLIKSKQNRTIYLGQTLPLSDLLEVITLHKPDYLMTIITSPLENMDQFVTNLAIKFPACKILLSGLQIVGHKNESWPANVLVFTHPDQLIRYLDVHPAEVL